jgi:hypothetical protein
MKNILFSGLLVFAVCAEQPVLGAELALHENVSVNFQCTNTVGLANSQQLETERRIVDVLADTRLSSAIASIEALYSEDTQAQSESGQRSLRSAAESIAGAMAEWGVLLASRPEAFTWTNKTGHSWFDLRVPNTGYGIENPDNVYRHFMLDPTLSYRITGRAGTLEPMQQSFIVYGALPGTQAMTREGAGLVAVLADPERDSDGKSFTITMDPQPANGRINHLQLTAAATLLIVRDSLSNWAQEQPIDLSIEVLTPGYTPKTYSHDEAVKNTLALLDGVPKFWLDYDNTYIYSRAANFIAEPRVRQAGWGGAISGWAELGSDQALKVTLSTFGARYLGFQLADPWGVSLNYVDKTGSMSNHQAKANPDDTITYLIAARDPGYHNWLDTSGLNRVIFAIRWQDFEQPITSLADAVVDVQLISLNSRDALDTTAITPIQRSEQLAQRVLDYQQRLGCGPAGD